MKKIINVELKTKAVGLSECKTQMLVLGHFSDAKQLDAANREIDKRLNGAIERVIKLGDFKGKDGTSAVVYNNGKIAAERVLVVGLGEQKKVTTDTFRKASSIAANKAVSMKVRKMALALHKASDSKLEPAILAQAIAEGVFYGSFRYDEYITADEDGRSDLLVVEVIDDNAAKIKRLEDGLKKGAIIGNAQSYARALANRPGNVINPPSLAAEAKKLAAKTKGLSCKVLDEKQLAKLGMGGILAVGSGSKTPPRLIIVKYSPKGKVGKLPTVALVGKAITFDSGGISIKPARRIWSR